MEDLGTLLEQMERIESEVGRRLARLRHRLVQGEAKEGLVTATVDIWFSVRNLHIDKQRLSSEGCDLDALEGMIVDAVNDAIGNARKILKTEIGGVIGGQFPCDIADFFGRNVHGDQ